MTWITLPGLPGKVYVPEHPGASPKKHACRTCLACQWCDETRCEVCRSLECRGPNDTGSPDCLKNLPEPPENQQS